MHPWLLEARAPFLTASVVPVLLGGAYALFAFGAVDLPLLLVTLAGVALLHLGTNLANEYFDFKSGADAANQHRNPFSGGSGLLPAGRMDPAKVHRAALLCFALGALIGIALTALRGPAVLALGLVGALSGYLYTAPRANLGARGIGELLVGLNFGVLVVVGTVLVQTGVLSWGAALASLPVAFLIAAVLYVNQFPDYEADKKVGKRNLVVRLGPQRAFTGYAALMALTYLSLAAAVALGALPLLALAGLVTLPLAAKSVSTLRRHRAEFPQMLPANAGTVMSHLLTGLILAGATLAAAL